jgi:hypothetical protein
MTRKQRDAAQQRLVALNSRLDAVKAATENMSDKGGIEILNIINETAAEIEALERTLATSLVYLFNFIGGGWNSEVAYTQEDAIEQAIAKYGNPNTQTMLRVDVTTFRLSTTEDYSRNMASFY